VRRDTQNVLLVLLGGALVKIAATDLYLRYVKPATAGTCSPAPSSCCWPLSAWCGTPGWSARHRWVLGR